MMKIVFNNNDEIKTELKKLRLQRDISLEELKIVKHQFKEDLSLPNWFQTVVQTAGKYGVYNVIRKIFK